VINFDGNETSIANIVGSEQTTVYHKRYCLVSAREAAFVGQVLLYKAKL
jgi:hypothetical protein